jgi:hypothetical protein
MRLQYPLKLKFFGETVRSLHWNIFLQFEETLWIVDLLRVDGGISLSLFSNDGSRVWEEHRVRRSFHTCATSKCCSAALGSH